MSSYDEHGKKIVINRIKRENVIYHYHNHELSYNYNNKNFKLLVKGYPFRVPRKLRVNNKIINYNEISNKYSKYLNKYFDIQCFCCTSILCENKWNISYKFIDICKEYEEFINILKYIENFLLIINKNRLPKEIETNIISYLKPKK